MFLGKCDAGIEVPDAFNCPRSHPLPVVADVVSEPAGSSPHSLSAHLLLRSRIHWRLAGELGRDLDESLGDEDRNRVQVAGVASQPQPLRFERYRPTSTEGIVDWRRIAAGGFQDLCTRLIQY